MAATPEMLRIAVKTKPEMVTLVPEKRQELTTEGGLDVIAHKKKIKNAVKKLHDAGIPVSLFINPYAEDIETSKETGADMVEIHTGRYADAKGKRKDTELKRVYTACEVARQVGITFNAGHGLNYFNVQPVAQIEGLRGLYIGHSIIARAVLTGLEQAVREMRYLIDQNAI